MKTQQRNTLYGFYSEEESKLTGSVFFRTLLGKEVEVTRVQEDPNLPYEWPDIKLVGIVEKFVRPGRPGTLTSVEDLDYLVAPDPSEPQAPRPY